jgi:hypothetical protein
VARSEDKLSARVRLALEDQAPAESEGLDRTPLEQLRHLAATAHSESVRVQALKVLLEREDRQAQLAQVQPEQPGARCERCARTWQRRPEPSEEDQLREAAEVALILAEAGALTAVIEGRPPSGSALD